MAEKKIHKKLVETLTKYEEREQKASAYLLRKHREKREGIPPEVLHLARAIQEREYRTKPGTLAALYSTFLAYTKTTPPAERKSLEGVVRLYWLYQEAVQNVAPYYGSPVPPEELLKQEAITVMILNHRRGDKRFSDLFNSHMFLEDSGEEILYCAPWKTWLTWDGRRWKKDQENEIFQLAIDSIKRMYEKALGRPHEEALLLMEHAVRSESMRKIEAVVRVTAWNRRVRVSPDDLDRDPFLFNCENGLIDLSCGRLLPHRRERKITKLSPVSYEQGAPCPLWINFLKEIFHKNKQMIGYVQKIMGWSLTGDVSAQAMFILYGSGANGKSTFLNTVMKVLGDYATNTPTETFMQKRENGATNDIARLKGARFVSAMEAERGMKLAEAVIKRLTGNDPISARFLYGEFFEFLPTFKIFMATNHKPKIGGMDNAIWRRIKLIPFEATIPESKQDTKLSQKLETELPGILSWMVEGCIAWQVEGLGNSPAIMEATREYRQEMSAVETFLDECCIKREFSLVKAAHLYEEYKKWAEENGEHTMSMRALGTRLSETGLDKTRLSKGYHWLGIGLKDENEMTR